MSLPDFSRQMPIFGVQNLLGTAFDPDDRFRLFAQIVYPRLVAARPALESCYCLDNGRPGVEPVLLLGISILQFMERVPDRQAMELLRYHLGWKLALQLELDVAAPDPSCLSYFRQRLVGHEQAKLAFDTVLEGLREAGLVSRKAKQRLDSTHVLGAVAAMGSVECVRQTLRLALRELDAVAGLERPEFWNRLWERYVQNKLDYRLEEAALAEKHLEAGRDLAELSAWLDRQAQAVRGGPQASLVKRVLDEQFEVAEGQLSKRKDRPSDAVKNPNDPEAQWSSKGKTGAKGWVGHKGKIAETVEEGEREKDEPTAVVPDGDRDAAGHGRGAGGDGAGAGKREGLGAGAAARAVRGCRVRVGPSVEGCGGRRAGAGRAGVGQFAPAGGVPHRGLRGRCRGATGDLPGGESQRHLHAGGGPGRRGGDV